MGWFRIDDGLTQHPKVTAIPRRDRAAAMGLFVLAGSWCSRHLTDGHVPLHMLDELAATQRSADCLVFTGLWRATDTGWVFNDWSEYNPTRAEVEAKRQARADAGREGGKRSGEARSKQNRSNREAKPKHGASTVSNPRPVPSRPLPVPNGTGGEVVLFDEAETVNQRAQRLTRTYSEAVPISNFPAVMGIVKKAINARKSDDEITSALLRLAADGRPVTTETFRIELEGLPARRQQRTPQDDTDDYFARALERAAEQDARDSA